MIIHFYFVISKSKCMIMKPQIEKYGLTVSKYLSFRFFFLNGNTLEAPLHWLGERLFKK